MDFRFRYRRHRPPSETREQQQRRERDARLRIRSLAVGLSIPTSLVAGPVGGWMLGAWLDHRLGTEFWTTTLVIAGTIGGLAAVMEMLIMLGRES